MLHCFSIISLTFYYQLDYEKESETLMLEKPGSEIKREELKLFSVCMYLCKMCVYYTLVFTWFGVVSMPEGILELLK